VPRAGPGGHYGKVGARYLLDLTVERVVAISGSGNFAPHDADAALADRSPVLRARLGPSKQKVPHEPAWPAW
jgi:hypothetical protein